MRMHRRHGDEPWQQEHIHIDRRGLGGRYSWNVDGSRHDKHSFPKSEKWIERAKALAAPRLGVPVSTLQFLAGVGGGGVLAVREASSGENREVFRAYIRSGEDIFFFGSEQGLLLVIAESD
jgi:hypothetical protein